MERMPGKASRPLPSYLIQVRKYAEGLARKRNLMLSAHFGADGGNRPNRLVQIKFGPFRQPQFASARVETVNGAKEGA
jgi:hypothetical protein